MYVISSAIKEYSVSGEISQTTTQLHCFKSLFENIISTGEKAFYIYTHSVILLQQAFR